jgi:NADH dehydrogenase (ubiquinone) 1 alpha subcomplex subunit 2
MSHEHPLNNLHSDFVAKNYVNIKKANPELPILVREASGIEARAFARFGKALEIRIYCRFLN